MNALMRLGQKLPLLLWCALGACDSGCASAQTSRPAGAPAAPFVSGAISPTPASGARILLGIDVLASQNFALLQGQRVGLLTHPAGVNRDGVSTIDVLRSAPGVKLVALYGPEHGLYGDETANAPVANRADQRTGLPVYSLYNTPTGDFRKATAAMLRGIDVMVVDLQDIGTRSYTFISCMLYTMAACFEQGKTIIVLDRPDPLGGLKVGGPIVEEQYMSYVGAYRIPYVFGLTIGELAQMARDNPDFINFDLLKTPKDTWSRGRLIVVPMRGWRRSMLWPDTGLKWVPTSPYITTVAAVFGYSLTGLGGQIGSFGHGVGTPYPFRLLNYPGRTPAELAAILNAKNLPGLSFTPLSYKDDKERSGVYVNITNWNAVRPTELSFEMMKLAATWASGNPFAKANGTQADLFNKHVGSFTWWREISTKGGKADVENYFRLWEVQDAQYQQRSKRWWLYPE